MKHIIISAASYFLFYLPCKFKSFLISFTSRYTVVYYPCHVKAHVNVFFLKRKKEVKGYS